VARQATGQARYRGGRWTARVTVEPGKRKSFELPTCDTEAQARKRAALLAELASELCAAGVELEVLLGLLERAAGASKEGLPAVQRAAAAVVEGNTVPEGSREGMTVRELAQLWTSGELARRYPDHVRRKSRLRDDVGRFRTHILPVVGDVPVADFNLAHAEQVMAALPARLAAATRRQVALAIHRLMALAVFPMRLRSDNPLPRGWLPKPSPPKAKSYLRPDEEARLLGCIEVPLARRVLYGFLAREGMRRGEALALRWDEIDLERGAVRLDVNKTDDPRAWALGADVAEALRRWHTYLGEPAGEVLVFQPEGMVLPEARAKAFREHLQLAGVDRAELYERNAHRQPIRLHDLRATFCTLALATGRSETWVADRTGHRSSVMINRYRRAARTAAELGLGWLVDIAETTPELASARRRAVPRMASAKGPKKAPGASARREARISGPKTLTVSSGCRGAQGQSRTVDTRIFSPLLYQLSYLG